jgi:predicted NUDIX family NTP pyrophosphohydrolase
MYRRRDGRLEVLLAHPGGPLFRNKDRGAWSIPKGEIAAGEDPQAAARREFLEETGTAAPCELLALTPIRQKAGKLVYAWACEGNLDAAAIRSNTFTMTWPPGSGRQATFPEIDRAEWFELPEARRKINPAQAALLDELAQLVG